MKMADVDVDSVSDHDKTDTHPSRGETIPFTLGEMIEGGSTWEPEQETSLGGGETQSTRFKEFFIEKLY